MGDSEDNFQPSKKRAAGRELSRDNPGLDDEDTSDQETGTFKKASDDVIASRRIVKVRRNTTAPSSNPFAGIQLVPPTNSPAIPVAGSTETIPEKVEEKSSANQETEENDKHPGVNVPEGKPESNVENVEESDKTKNEKITEGNKADEEGKEDAEANNGEGEACKDANEAKKDVEAESGELKVDKDAKKDVEAESGELKVDKDANDAKTETEEAKGGDNVEKSVEASPFSSFQQLSSNQNAFTGLAGTGFSSSPFSFGSITKNDSGSSSPFSFGLPNNVNSSLFGHPGVSVVNKSEGTKFPPMQEVPTETGEENENAVFTADSMLFEFLDGSWKERGKGEVKVNVSTETGKARLVMRTKGNYRLILNASLYPDMKLANMEKKGITFACINSASEGKGDLSTHALKFKDASFVEEFRAAVTEHKGKAAVSLKTPENSPKASDD